MNDIDLWYEAEDLTEENVKKWVIEYAIEEVTDAIKRTQNP